MKIDNSNLGGVSPDKSQQINAAKPDPAGSRQAAAAASGDPGDQVTLSSLSERLAVAGTESPERAARIERLAGEVASGRYSVDALVLGRRMIDEMLKPSL